jgi:glutathione peroxidase
VSEAILNKQPKRSYLREKIKFRVSLVLLMLVGLASLLVRCAAALQAKPADAPTSKSAAKEESGAAKKGAKGADKGGDAAAKPEKSAYDYNLPGADGKDVPLSNFKGKYIVVVNLGRKSTYNEQLAALIKLNDTYKDKGVVVVGVPSNDFGAAEPGTGPEIQKAYADAKVDFPLMCVSKLSGDEELPFFVYLTKSKSAPPGGPVHWNFTKFVIDKKGNVVARLDPDVAPDSPEMLSTLDQILGGTYKPKKSGTKPKGAAPPSDDDDDD